jgi:hypothetical protein
LEFRDVAKGNPFQEKVERGIYKRVNGVAATSTRNAWAVGSNGLGKTLIMHWNGSAWTQVPSPNFGGVNSLAGVAAVSANNVWAVGQTGSLSSPKSLILRWNGKAWKRVPSPSPGGGDWLDSVAVVSARTCGRAVRATASGR